MAEISWKEESCIEGTVSIDAQKGEFGPTKWVLSIETSEGNISIKPTPDIMIPGIARKIRSIEDYYTLINTKDKLDYEKISKLWLDLAASAYNNDLQISGDVALISSDPLNVKGMRVIPKEWDNPIQDGIIVHFSNFWICDYNIDESEPDKRKTVFRLSSYDANKFGKVNAKDATEYIDFDPIRDRELIMKILKNAIMIYSPDLRFHGLRAAYGLKFK